MYLLEDILNMFDVVQRQIGNDAVPHMFRVLILLYSADAVLDFFFCVPLFGFLNHFSAQVKPQYPYRPLFRRKFAVPAVTASQIQHCFSKKRRKQGL
jgi:hypothetical protein